MTAKTRIIPALFLAAMLLPSAVRADTEGPYTYTVTNGMATIIRFSASYSGALSITNELGGCPVTTIGNYAFCGCTSLTSVYFAGNAPTPGSPLFSKNTATVYYLPGTTGWGATYAGRPTAVWKRQAP